MTATSDIAFTPAVKAVQSRRGSRRAYERMEKRNPWPRLITPDLAAFIAQRDSLYIATANSRGQPYIQHRGGPRGFLRVVDDRTLGFVDFRGNRQYVTVGNLSENERAFIFLMDYERRLRIKIWGKAKVVADDADLISRLLPVGYKVVPEHAVVFAVEAWDVNCPRHIPRMTPVRAAEPVVAQLQARIAELEEQLAQLRRDVPSRIAGATADAV